MTATEFRTKVISLEQKIAFNKSIKCPLVAARYERQLKELKKDYESQSQEK